MLDNAIENISKNQPASATPLADGDSWNGCDVDKCLKLAYGLKARWLNNLTKKSFYDTDEVLQALDQAAQSVSDNTVMRYIISATSDRAGSLASLQFGNVGSTTTRMSKWYTDLLTNTFEGGTGVLDTRATRIIPSGEVTTAEGEKDRRMSKGVDRIN